MSKTIQFTTDPAQNFIAHPTKGSANIFDLSYYTLCKLADAIQHVYPTPETVAYAVKQGAKGILTLDDLGNFISWE